MFDLLNSKAYTVAMAIFVTSTALLAFGHIDPLIWQWATGFSVTPITVREGMEKWGAARAQTTQAAKEAVSHE